MHALARLVVSAPLRDLVKDLLQVNPKRRPGINRILSRDVIRGRIQNLLSTAVINHEFNHTVLHGRHALRDAARNNDRQAAVQAANAKEQARRDQDARRAAARKHVAAPSSYRSGGGGGGGGGAGAGAAAGARG